MERIGSAAVMSEAAADTGHRCDNEQTRGSKDGRRKPQEKGNKKRLQEYIEREYIQQSVLLPLG